VTSQAFIVDGGLGPRSSPRTQSYRRMSTWPESEGRQLVAAEAPPLLDVFALTRVSARRSLWRGLIAGAAYVYGLPFGWALGVGGSHG
jgi:hypothetical protein